MLQFFERAKLDASGMLLKSPGRPSIKFSTVPKITSNRSYFNGQSVAFFAKRTVRVRGHMEPSQSGEQHFVARVLWPEDFLIDPTSSSLDPLRGTKPSARTC